MWICPVCKKDNKEDKESRCRACGFDSSCYYEEYHTISPLPGEISSVSGRNSSPLYGPKDMIAAFDDGRFIVDTGKTKRERGSEENPKDYVIVKRSDIVRASVGEHHTAAVLTDGTVIAAGDNSYEECEVSDWKDITEIACGQEHTIGLKDNGTVLVTGGNHLGQCEVSEWKDIRAIACGDNHTVGLKADGTVVAVGDNFPCEQCEVSDWENITAIACGALHTVGLKADGTVVTTDEDYDLSDWENITAIACGPLLTVGLRADGTIVAADDNGEYDFRDQKNMIKIACAAHHIFGLRADNKLLIINCMIEDEPETKETNTENDDILRDCIREALEKVDISPKAETSESAQEQKSTAEGSKKEATPKTETVDDDLLKAFRDSLMALGFAKSEE